MTDFTPEFIQTELAKAAKARVAELEAAARWIPFTEKLPEEGQRVIALSKHGFVVDFCFSYAFSDAEIEYWMSYWMPLPEPEEVEE